MPSAEPEIKEGIFSNNDNKKPQEIILLSSVLFQVLFFFSFSAPSLSSCLVNRVHKVDKDASGLIYDYK